MKGTITDIKRFAVHDGPGIRTTVFFKGCPLRCQWCHNPECISREPEITETETLLDGRRFVRSRTVGREISAGELLTELLKEYTFMEVSGGGVTFSGGEPLMQDGFLLEILGLCRQRGIHIAVDTSLAVAPERVEKIMPLTGLFLVDIKTMDSALHQKYTGVPNGIVLENIELLSRNGAHICIRIPVVPGFNDSKDNAEKTASFLNGLPRPVKQVDLLPFHNIARHKYRRLGMETPFMDMPSAEKHELEWLREFFEKEGFAVTIGG